MILVAGGTGRLGRKVVEHLAARDMPVRILSRDPSRARASIGDGIDIVPGDVRVAASLAAAFIGVDTVISAVTGFGPGGDGPRKVDLDGNANLIEVAQTTGVKHFILLSIHGASPKHPMELYRAKFLAEQRLRKSGLEWTVIRPTVFMELWAGIIGDPLLAGGTATVFGRGDNPINFVSVQDVARCVERAVLDRHLRGKALEVGGPQNLTLNRLLEIVAESNGLKAQSRHIPLAALRAGALALRFFKPDIASLLRAAVLMETADMTFNPVTRRDVHLTHLAEVARPSSRVSIVS